jgi:glycosyltransferase involved in cell wall biosynthesis
LVAGASLFASPSVQENFGLAVAEAMAAGVPVLVTPGVNLSEAIAAAGAGWIVSRDVAGISGGLSAAFEDAEGRAERGAAAQRLARGFRWPHSIDTLVGLYDDVRTTRGSRADA